MNLFHPSSRWASILLILAAALAPAALANGPSGRHSPASTYPLPLRFPGEPIEPLQRELSPGLQLFRDDAVENLPFEASRAPRSASHLQGPSDTDAGPATRPELPSAPANAIEWQPLLLQSAFFLGIQHGFRFATEAGTRAGMKGAFFPGWYDSLSALHGWGDGDPFYVNYIGHPLQGSASGFLFQANDPRYRAIEFGNNPDYWKSRLRAAAFAFAYSTQFELGPLSEASLGKIQRDYPQQGFVDHVATPVIGTLWMIGEDFLDRHVVRPLEGRTENPWIRMMARGWLNPSRSFANMMRLKVPWWRDSRSGIWVYKASEELRRQELEKAGRLAARTSGDSAISGGEVEKPWNVLAPFEFSASTVYSHHPDGPIGLNCIGGGATAVWNRSQTFSWVAEVSGCKLFTFDPSLSGDVLHYRVGPRWTKRGGRLIPYGQVLIGGKRATVENIPESAREELERINKLPREQRPSRWEVVDRQQTNGFALSVGAGLELGLNRAASLRLASFDYTRAWIPANTLASYPNSYKVSMGMVLRIGTW